MTMVLFDHMRALPPCTTCGSTAIKKSDLKIDGIRGRWKGEWICENGHTNIM